MQFWLNFAQIWWHGNSLASLEILGGLFIFADPKTFNYQFFTIYTKIVSIFCTEMKLCLFECLAYIFTIAGRGNFLDFCEKVEIVKKLIKHQMGIVSISCTEMKLCLFECLAYIFTIAGIGNFLDFCEK